MKVICISGKARHGKDTVAGILTDQLIENGNRVCVTHFADLVKYVCTKFFNWDGTKDEQGRTLLQYVGTDVVRSQRPSYWTDFIVSILQMFPNEWDYVLIPDCRFPNEFECFKAAGFDTTLVRVFRPNFVSDLTPEQLKHPSETAMDDCTPDFYISNSGDLNELSTAVKNMINSME